MSSPGRSILYIAAEYRAAEVRAKGHELEVAVSLFQDALHGVVEMRHCIVNRHDDADGLVVPSRIHRAVSADYARKGNACVGVPLRRQRMLLGIADCIA